MLINAINASCWPLTPTRKGPEISALGQRVPQHSPRGRPGTGAAGVPTGAPGAGAVIAEDRLRSRVMTAAFLMSEGTPPRGNAISHQGK